MAETAPPSKLIPDELLNNIKKGDCVLFLGADLPLGYPGAPLSRPELAAALAAKHALPPGLSWPETADQYLGQVTNDLNGLITFLGEHSRGAQVEPGALHNAIARAGFRAIVSAWYDDLLEQALQQAGYRVSQVVRDVQIPYAQEGEREVIVVKLYGSLGDPESLILTSWEHEELMDGLSRKLELVTGFCSLRPPLFVGFNLADPLPMRLYVRASANLVEHMKRAYVVWPGDVKAVQHKWRGKNVAFVRLGASEFMTALAEQIPTAHLAARRAIRVQKPPYKFLDYYTADDELLFCGRETESQIVTRLALSHRLLTLFGPSGAGKTSLLLAGVLPRLAAEGYAPVYVRLLDEPLAALRKAAAGRLGQPDWQRGADLRAFFSALLGEQDKLVVVLDQGEELFLRSSYARRQAFFAELSALLQDPPRDVRFIFSLREDYLAHLDEARQHLPGIFSDSFRLGALERAHARVAISEPAARAGVEIEPALVDALVGPEGRPDRFSGKRSDNLTGLEGDLVESDGSIPPAALQIVLDRLYRMALPAGHNPADPPPPGVRLTLGQYRCCTRRIGQGMQAEELTGAPAILADYVAEGLERLEKLTADDGKTPLGADAGLGRAILQVMVTSQKTKAALTEAEILAGLEEDGVLRPADETDRRLARQTRLGLERVRLLRSFERDGRAFYELSHDHLAKEIAASLSQAELDARAARELLRRELETWRHNRLLIPLEALKLIHERRAALKRLGTEELELLLRSALAAGHEAVYWFERAGQGGVEVQAIALEGLQAGNFRARAAAVRALAGLGQLVGEEQKFNFWQKLNFLLGDDYPQVRAAAIQALERLQPTGEWRAQLKYECYVPAGKFTLGEGEEAHEINLEAFYIGKYPVTNAEYRRYRQDQGQPFELPPGKEKHPVVNVSWYDARDYAAWAGMRLLTEAEWEKAASWEPDLTGFEQTQVGIVDRVSKFLNRAGERGNLSGLSGKKRKYPWGDIFDKAKCNTSESGIKTTTPVGKYSPGLNPELVEGGDSAYGCADMAGNVWEWTSSLYKGYPYDVGDGREDPHSGVPRVLRGGSWVDYGGGARCASRYDHVPSSRLVYGGFRAGASFPSPALESDALEAEL